jgi:1-acyl-sn-glycerol-3-phosphate acyltransferase
MQLLAAETHRPEPASVISADEVIQVVTDLYSELHHSATEQPMLGLQSRLEGDLGFDSLARVELLARLGRRFDIQLSYSALERFDTIADLVAAVNAARANGAQERPAEASPTHLKPIGIPRPAPGTPVNAATLNDVLNWHLEQHPQAIHAILLEDDHPTPLTYAALAEGAQAIAAALQAGGVLPGQAVALMLPTGIAYLQTFFGVLRAGAIPVPIYPPSSISQLEDHIHRHTRVLGNARATALITVPEAHAVATSLQARVPGLQHVWSVTELLQGSTSKPIPCILTADSLALLQYTSGSTGDPKGVMLTHGQLLANIRALGQTLQATPDDVFVSWLPLYHDMGLIGAWLGSLYFSCLLILMSPTAFLARPARWLQAIQEYRGTLTGSPTFGYDLCTRQVSDTDLEGIDLSSVRFAFCGAEAVYPDTLERFGQRFATRGFRAQAFAPAYGLAEAAVALTVPPVGRGLRVDRIDRQLMARTGRAKPVASEDAHALRFVSCGPPLPGYQIRILDETGAQLTERCEGSLQFKGPSATGGYYGNPEATARLRHGEWLETGDRGYIADGELYVTGRSKDMIIRRGQHIYPEEIENALGELAGVRKGCVVVFGSKAADTSTERLIVFAETPYTEVEERSKLVRRINQCVVGCIGEPPEEVVFGTPYSVLKTSSGKLRRDATRLAYEKGNLGRAPSAPSIQMAHLMLEGLQIRLHRLYTAGVHLAYGLYAGCALLAFVLPLALIIPLLLDQSRIWRWVHQSARGLLHVLGIPLTVEAQTAVDFSPPQVIVFNHCGYADAVVVAAVLCGPQVFTAKSELQQTRLTAFYLRKLGALFIDRFAPAQSAAEVEEMTAVIQRGSPVVVFPEGTFTAETGLRAFHLGAFQAAVAAHVPVIPIALQGTRAILRDGTRLPHRAPVRAIVGPPLRARPDEDPFTAAVRLRDEAREYILRHCGEPDLSR